MKKKKRNLLYSLSFIALLTFIISCQKEGLKDVSNPNEEVITKVKSWLDGKKIDTTNNRNIKIESLKENLDFNSIHFEKYKQNDQLIVVPIKNSFKSTNNEGKNPVCYLVLLLTEQGDITKGNMIQYMSATAQKQVPGNTFSKIFNYQALDCNGQFTVLTIADDFLYELKFENDKLKSVAERRNEPTSGNHRTNGCIDWFLVTTIYYYDGSSSVNENYLFTICDGACQETRTAYGRTYQINCGGGGGNNLDYEYEVMRQTPEWDVYIFPGNIYAVKSWEVLKGKKVASEPFGGHFTHASHAGDGCNNPDGVWGAFNWDLNFSQTSASARIRGTWSSQGTNTPIEGFHSWSFQEIFP